MFQGNAEGYLPNLKLLEGVNRFGANACNGGEFTASQPSDPLNTKVEHIPIM